MKQGLSFDDVLLVPGRSEIVPREVDTKTRLTGQIELNVPLLSAAMDTVTEARLAIALAREGGIGIIHKNLTIEQQADEIDKVKRSQSGVISSPISLSPEHTVQDAVDLMAKYHISGIPVTETSGKLVGILTNRDLRFHSDFSMPLAQAMTRERLITAAPGPVWKRQVRCFTPIE